MRMKSWLQMLWLRWTALSNPLESELSSWKSLRVSMGPSQKIRLFITKPRRRTLLQRRPNIKIFSLHLSQLPKLNLWWPHSIQQCKVEVKLVLSMINNRIPYTNRKQLKLRMPTQRRSLILPSMTLKKMVMLMSSSQLMNMTISFALRTLHSSTQSPRTLPNTRKTLCNSIVAVCWCLLWVHLSVLYWFLLMLWLRSRFSKLQQQIQETLKAYMEWKFKHIIFLQPMILV